jgi:cation:H+ antiporter
MTTALLLLFSIAIILSGALLFTNGVEWLGTKLDLGQGAVGSLLAAVATALPETLIPVTAVVRGGAGSHEVATGAILGAPFLLATLAMALVGSAAYRWRGRRPQGAALDVHVPTLERDLGFFIAASRSHSHSASSASRPGCASSPPSRSSSPTAPTSASRSRRAARWQWNRS